jgi:hypothetical protein
MSGIGWIILSDEFERCAGSEASVCFERTQHIGIRVENLIADTSPPT